MNRTKKGLFSSLVVGAMCLTSLVGANISPKNVSASTTIASTTATGITNVFKDASGNKYLKAYVGISETLNTYWQNATDDMKLYNSMFNTGKYSTGADLKDTRGTYKYFKYEDIVWNVLSVDNGIALVVSNQILANMPFQPTYTADTSSSDESTKYTTTANGAPSGTLANNYTYSNIRYWLNGYKISGYTGKNPHMSLDEMGYDSATLNFGTSFYDVAFSSSEKSKIQSTSYTLASDKTDTTTYSAKAFNQSSPTTSGDKVFLLSYGDWETYYNADGDYSDAIKFTSDLALSQFSTDLNYADMNNMNNMDSTFTVPQTDTPTGNGGFWWLRSPSASDAILAYIVYYDGLGGSGDVILPFFGVAPALFLNTAGMQAYTSTECTTSQASVTAGSYVKFGSYPQTIADAVEGTLDDGGGSTEAGVEITFVGTAVSGAILLGLLAWMAGVTHKRKGA